MSKTTTAPASSVATTSEATQKFLSLRQPVDENMYPTSRVFRPGHCYRYPFVFVIPRALLPQSCTHDTHFSHVKQAHLKTPPTLNDAQLRKRGSSSVEDMAPGNCRISYAVRAVLSRELPGSHKKKVLGGCTKSLRVIPTAEKSLCSTPITGANLPTRVEHDMKRGIARGTRGRMVVETSHPAPVLLRYPSESKCASTTVQVNLRFDPVHDSSPPQPKEISTKLQASTFYSTVPWDNYASWNDQTLLDGRGREAFAETFKASSFGIGTLEWAKHSCEANGLQTEHRQKEPLPCPSKSFAGGSYYTSFIALPITLPENKTYLPTFHSCLISRTYSLRLRVSYCAPKTNLYTPGSTLEIPLSLLYTSEDHPMILPCSEEELSASDSHTTSCCCYQSQCPGPPEYSTLINNQQFSSI